MTKQDTATNRLHLQSTTPPTVLTSQKTAAPNSSQLQESSKKDAAYKFLLTLPEFAHLPDDELRTLAESCRFATLDSGQCITAEGDEEGPNGFIVVAGCLSMSKTSPSGKILIVELLQAGDVFGLLLALSGERACAQLSARAIQISTVLWMPIKKFIHMLKGHPDLLSSHIAHLLRCLQSSYRLSRSLAHDKVEVRIAAVLSSLVLKFDHPISSEKPCTIYFTRQQLADLTGTTSETAIRVTRAMQRDGLIDIKRPGVIRVLDPKALNHIAEDW